VLLLHSNLTYKFSLIGGFSIQLHDNSEVAYFLLGHPVYRSENNALQMSHISRKTPTAIRIDLHVHWLRGSSCATETRNCTFDDSLTFLLCSFRVDKNIIKDYQTAWSRMYQADCV